MKVRVFARQRLIERCEL